MVKWTDEQKAKACIYALLDADGRVRYIGKANDPAKRLSSHMRDSKKRNTPLYAWIRKHGTPQMIVLIKDCDDWRAEEIKAISAAREAGARLLNLADGGDEPFCPLDVRVANGRKSAAIRSKVLWRVYRHLGGSAEWFKKRGDDARHQMMRDAVDMLKWAELHARQAGTLGALEAMVEQRFGGAA